MTQAAEKPTHDQAAATPASGADIALSVRGLTVEFSTDRGVLRAVDGVDLQLPKGKTLGIVGESGSGKSVTALAIMRLLATPPASIVAGSVTWDDKDLLKLPEAQMRALRGNRISMVFQEPMTSLNPVFTVGDQIGESLKLHRGMSRDEARTEAIEMLRLCGIPAPEDRIDVYPHQLSGGMRQRVMIAMALSCRPDVLIADEPTTALDVTIQAQILDLLRLLQKQLGMSVVLITHDLGVVAQTCDVVQVMYAGTVVERASVADLFANPRHPYTLGLLRSIPGALPDDELPRGDDGRPRLFTIPGMVPDLRDIAPGCRFQDRCDYADDLCRGTEPRLEAVDDDHLVRCVHLVPLRTPRANATAPAKAN